MTYLFGLIEKARAGDVVALYDLQAVLRGAALETRNVAARWGTSAGELLSDPDLLYQALNELSEEELDEAFDSATDFTFIVVTPLRGVGGRSASVSRIIVAEREIPQTLLEVPGEEGRLLGAGRELPQLDDRIATRSPRDVSVNPNRPDPLSLRRAVGLSDSQNAVVQADIAEAQRLGATEIRVNQHMVDIEGTRVGVNRPDLQFTLDGKRYYIEYDTSSSGRRLPHQVRIPLNDPDAVVILKIVD